MSSASASIAPVGIIEDRHYVSRVRRWMRYRRELAGFVIDVLCVLIEERATGRLQINFSEGCAASVEFEEQAQLPSA
jgi:hypothetical protein